ncbi:MAG: chemotaxis protein CheW [Ignavibacteria bacterium]|jgi:purine-binding chemotaxis protein CheW|nr:chemotaxis protein CheW [Ignavibacteria bacterium]
MSEDVKTVHKAPETHGASVHEIGDDYLQIIGFTLGDEEFGVDIFAIKEIIRMPVMTRVPNAPRFVVGVVNMRGKVIPIIDLCIRFNLPMSEKRISDRKIIVIEHENKTVGFLVDAVNQVLNINKSATEPPPAMVSGIESDYITAIAKMDDLLLILLEISKILVLVNEVPLGAK